MIREAAVSDCDIKNHASTVDAEKDRQDTGRIALKNAAGQILKASGAHPANQSQQGSRQAQRYGKAE